MSPDNPKHYAPFKHGAGKVEGNRASRRDVAYHDALARAQGRRDAGSGLPSNFVVGKEKIDDAMVALGQAMARFSLGPSDAWKKVQDTDTKCYVKDWLLR